MRCPLHGSGADPTRLVGRAVEKVVASWHVSDGERSELPLDVWLTDSEGDITRITTGSDHCLIVECAPPHEPYDLGEWGRVEVGEDLGDHPFLRHLGEPVTSVAEFALPDHGRSRLEIVFPTGRVICDCHEGDLRLTRAPAQGVPAQGVAHGPAQPAVSQSSIPASSFARTSSGAAEPRTD
ncbi:hypothetical protein [Streptomyces sp. NPDC086023]|uniref:hypothetical protein n=1 Tax=Streptomyces sp. NPDC086023 TaxID=3365746 RepID=UPI0037D975C6